MKKAIVTGASGFIGTELCRVLNERNVTTYAVLREKDSYNNDLKQFKNIVPIICNMDEISSLPQMIKDDDIDAFFHLAWEGITGQGRGNHNRQLNSVRWAIEAAYAASQIGCKKFIGAGTLAEIDAYNYCIVDGSTPNLVSCYGTAKIAAHFMSKAVCCQLGMSHLWGYISNTYGENDTSNNFVNFASKLILSDEDAEFTAGEQYYDFVHVKDIALGLYCIGENGKDNHAYYIGSGNPRQLKDFIISMRDILNPSKEIHLGAIPFNGVSAPLSTFDCSKIEEHTGYHSAISFEDGILMLKKSRMEAH